MIEPAGWTIRNADGAHQPFLEAGDAGLLVLVDVGPGGGPDERGVLDVPQAERKVDPAVLRAGADGIAGGAPGVVVQRPATVSGLLAAVGTGDPAHVLRGDALEDGAHCLPVFRRVPEE